MPQPAGIPKVRNIFIRAYQTQKTLDKQAAEALLSQIAQTLGYTILKKASHAFSPGGVTAFLLLSESHISLHTWPESGFATIEMVTCKPFGKPELLVMVNYIKAALLPKRVRPILTL